MRLLLLLLCLALPAPVMAADIAFRASSLRNGYSGTAPTVTVPTGTATGDLMIVYLHTNGTGTVTDNNGGNAFTKDYEKIDATNGSGLTIFSRIIGSDTTGSYAFTVSSSSSRTTVQALAFSDPNPSNIYDIAPSNTYMTSVTNTASPGDVDGTSITTGFDKSIAIICAGQDVGAGTGTFDTTPTGYTALTQPTATTAQLSVVAHKVIAPAGSTGTPDLSTNTWGAGQQNISVHFAIRNNAGAGAATRSLMLMGVGL
mgnify:FL=1